MTIDLFMQHCLAKAGTEATYPFKGEAVWMKVAGKLFAMTNVEPLKMDGDLVEPFHFINVKSDPAHALQLREQWYAIRPGWHQNKVHWNSLIMDGSLPDTLIANLIDQSYHLVVSSLSKTLQAQLNPDHK